MRAAVSFLALVTVAGLLESCSGQTGSGPREQPVIAPRANPGATYDGARHRVVVFGGEGAAYRDMWGWNGTRWNVISATGPSPRYDPVMGFDPARNRVVLFGGRAGAGPTAVALADTWEWNGSAWSKRDSTGPGPRAHAAGTFDETRGVLVVHGGFGPNDQPVHDTWEWDGTSWSRRDTVGLAGLAPNSMVYDPVRGKVQVLVSDLSQPAGGHRYGSQLWEWDGTQWTLRPGTPPPLSPVQRIASAGAGGGLILFDGDLSLGARGATWRYDNTTWIKVSSTGPSTRNGAVIVYDAARNKVVLFGGGTNTVNYGDTWEWNGTQWTDVTPP